LQQKIDHIAMGIKKVLRIDVIELKRDARGLVFLINDFAKSSALAITHLSVLIRSLEL